MLNPQSSLRHRYTSFDDAGLPEALRRGWALLDIKELDFDFWTSDFDQITFDVTNGRIDSGVLFASVTACRDAERRLRAELAAALVDEGASHVAAQWRPDATLEARLFEGVPALCDWSASGLEPETRMAIAVVRLALGAAIEAAFAKAGVAECWGMAKPGKAVPLGKARLGGEAWAKTADGKRQLNVARLYNDAALVAAWTSAHAAFVEDCQSGVLEPPSPSIFSVLNSFTEYNFGDLLARRVDVKDKNISKALPLLVLLIKAMNTSARGWEQVLEQLVPKSTCLRTIVGRALAVSCSGLHESVHPALRAPWPRRHAVARRVFKQISNDRLLPLMAGATTAVREAMRRLLLTTVACIPAVARALALGGHPIRMLNAPPLCAPAPGLEACAECFAAATSALLDHPSTELADALTHAFDQPLPWPRQKYDAGWLGKGSAPVSSVVPFVQTAGGVYAQAFRARFLPLWLHAFGRGHPVPRLEAAYHTALHALNSATHLVAELDEPTALRLQRLAMGHVSSGLLGAEEVSDLLGLPRALVEQPLAELDDAPAVAAAGADDDDGSDATPEEDDDTHGRGVAMALSWARAAWLSEKVTLYELGPRTTGMQVLAILRRLSRTDRLPEALALPLGELGRRKDEFLKDIPQQSTHLQACLSCGHVANPIVNDAKPGQHFDDVGAAIAMNTTGCIPGRADYGTQYLRCAKRASAALRTAVLYEASSVDAAVEQHAADLAAVEASIATAGKQRATASGVGARAKRDAKGALEQRCGPKGCGDDPLLVLPLVGRCIALRGVKYALCSFCAAAVRVEPKHRAGGEICCLRCDGRLVTGFPPPKADGDQEEDAAAAPARVCRYCGRVERTVGTHRSYKAPHDVSGANAALPPPLRQVAFCPAHQRSWLAPALRTLYTRSVLAHISYGARPAFGAAATSRLSNADLGVADDVGTVEVKKKGKKRKAER